ncbi:MAG: PEP-CTERM sorting domain-containing protein [Planctomycetota bacterium]
MSPTKQIAFAAFLFAFAVEAAFTGVCRGGVVFQSDFESGIPTNMSGTGVLTGTQGYSAFGFGNTFLRTEAGNGIGNGIELTLDNLPSHTSVSIDFLLAVIDSWDGVGNTVHGPDGLSVAVDGVIVFSEVFENSNSGVQTYVSPPGVTLARRESLGFAPTGIFFADSAYDMSLDATFSDIAHTSSSLTINWFRHSGLQINGSSSVPVDESWAIDNLSVTLGGVAAVPEPTSALLLLPLTAASMLRRTPKRRTKQ